MVRYSCDTPKVQCKKEKNSKKEQKNKIHVLLHKKFRQTSMTSLCEAETARQSTPSIASSTANAASAAIGADRRRPSTASTHELRRRRSRAAISRTLSRESVRSGSAAAPPSRHSEEAPTLLSLNGFRGFLDEFLKVKSQRAMG